MPEPRDCPLCGADMAPGSYSLEDTALRALVVGLSWQSLCFRPGSLEPGEPERQPIVYRVQARIRAKKLPLPRRCQPTASPESALLVEYTSP
jgi:hypothetical protein